MEKTIEIKSCGQNVILKIGNIEGMITGTIIRFDKVQYEFSYFYNGEMRILWISEYEMKNMNPEEKQLIGFSK